MVTAMADTPELRAARAAITTTPLNKAVSIILPVWNRADLTMQFLNQHWRMYKDRPDVEIVVVDNGSTDTTPGVIKQWEKVLLGRMKVVRHEFNYGFAAGHNVGAGVASGAILVFMSNDVVVNGDYVTLIEKKLADEPASLIGAEMLAHNTGWNTFAGVRQNGEAIAGKQTIPYLGGWCIAAMRLTWDALGGWDERYFPSDYEDVDLSYTAIQNGVRIVAIKLPLRHLFGQSAQAIEGGRQAATMKNREQFMRKWALSE